MSLALRDLDEVSVRADLVQATGSLLPSQPDSRRHFQQGEVMPDFKSPLWATLWQWNEDQKSPSQIDPHAGT